MNTQAGASSGWQTVTATEGSSSANLTIELVKGTAYLYGNAAGLYFQGFTRAAATVEAGKWISVPASSRIYASAVAGLTVKSTMEGMEMSGAVNAVAPTTIAGHQDPGYSGSTKPSAGQKSLREILYVSSTGAHLPVKAVVRGVTTLLSGWGSAVDVMAPAGAVRLEASWVRSS
jgi:hypothetical protein